MLHGPVPVRVPLSVVAVPLHTGVVAASVAVGRGFTVMVMGVAGLGQPLLLGKVAVTL